MASILSNYLAMTRIVRLLQCAIMLKSGLLIANQSVEFFKVMIRP